MSKEKVYPAIYEAIDGDKYLYLDGENYYCYVRGVWDKSSEEDNHANDKNITSEYLQNTYGEVVSAEYAEFIVELCKNHGIAILNKPWESATHFTISNNQLFFVSCAGIESTELKQITIPLPPKADKQEVSEWKPDFSDLPKHFDCMCNKCGGKCCTGQCSKQEVSEWPQVGDDVKISVGIGVVELLPDTRGYYVVSVDGEYYRCEVDELRKPKTPEEDLRDELIEYLNELGSSARYCFGGNELAADELLNAYNITKKV